MATASNPITPEDHEMFCDLVTRLAIAAADGDEVPEEAQEMVEEVIALFDAFTGWVEPGQPAPAAGTPSPR